MNSHCLARLSCLAAALLLASPAGASDSSSNSNAPAPTVRVLSYNIHHGQGIDGKLDIGRIAQLITHEKADLVALQEVDQGVKRTEGRDLPAELAKLTGLTCVFSTNLNFQGGGYGNAVLSRFPIRHWSNTALPRLHTNSEPRGILELLLEVQGRPLTFLDTHLDAGKDSAERLLSAQFILQRLAGSTNQPLILCGDFNDGPSSATYQTLAQTLTDTWNVVGVGPGLTIPVEKPKKRIDYIWFSKGGALRPLSIKVLNSEASDHLPVLAEFGWPTQ